MNIFEFTAMVHARIKRQKLREGFKTQDDFDIGRVIDKRAALAKYSKFDDPELPEDQRLEGQKHIFTKAKSGDSLAQQYVFYKLAPVITNAFWKNFLGPDGKMRQKRISNDDAWEDWLGLAWTTIFGGYTNNEKTSKPVMESFNPDKMTYGDLWAGLGKIAKMIFWNVSSAENFNNKLKGISGVTPPNSHDSEETKAAKRAIAPGHYESNITEGEMNWDNPGDDTGTHGSSEVYEDSTFRDVNDQIEADKFMSRWIQFCNDETLLKSNTTKNGEQLNALKVFADVISGDNKSLAEIGSKHGVSSGSINNYIVKIQKAFEKYNITNNDLQNAIKILGTEKLMPYLKGPAEPVTKNGTPKASLKDTPKLPKAAQVVAPKSQEAKKVTGNQSGSFEEKFKAAMDSDKMWIEYRGTNPGSIFSYSLEHPKATNEKIAKEFKIQDKTVREWLGRSLRILKQNGITADELAAQIKALGGKTLASWVGEEN
jgi:hypothetical protein